MACAGPKRDRNRRYITPTGQAKIDTEQGKQIFARRLGIVEPGIVNICVHKYLNRFTLRSKRKVDVQWTRTRFALVRNIGKIHTFGALN